MVSFIIIDQIILIFIYYYQINTDSHMASRGDAVAVSQEMSQVQSLVHVDTNKVLNLIK